ncbi:MAG: CvpA family protein [Nitrosomonadales bacterium]|jgi:membrane protein required for colicin V production|nr:CvpA family protein [Nitrosomonadales bacterium]MBT5149692.1 CvpA family protein [Nitrosomonadales bacterium]MBT5573129.1 CvpA family protein [Nitrosomonadales bacterium]MBT6250911.1 CvpA family protein [Nitrosomonadales bacterium]MBT6602506.1 CvpA family protein [Nitrosomonadales bacterium]
MSLIDILVILILFTSLIFGFFRGFVKELLSLLAWALAFFVAYFFASSVAIILPFESEFSIKYVSSFVIIFILVLIASSILIKFISTFIHKIGLGASNIILGGLFGVLRGVIIVYFLIFVIGKTSIVEDPSWQNSSSIALIKLLVEKTFPYLPQDWLNNVKYVDNTN